MTNTKSTRNAISRPDFLRAILNDDAIILSDEMRKTGETWLAALTKKRENTEPTKEQRANAQLLENVITAMIEVNEPITARWVVNNVNGVMTIQKASALLRKAVQSGRVTADVSKKVTEYSVA